MTVMVPYDASAPARAALWRGRQLTTTLDEPLLAVTVLPDDASYARAKCWFEPDGRFHPDRVATSLRQQVTDIAPTASFRCLRVGDAPEADGIAAVLRAHAVQVDATVLVVGCDGESPIATPLTAVEPEADRESYYDILIVRTAGTSEQCCPPDGDGA